LTAARSLKSRDTQISASRTMRVSHSWQPLCRIQSTFHAVFIRPQPSSF